MFAILVHWLIQHWVDWMQFFCVYNISGFNIV